LISTAIVLLCTMISVFEYRIVLIFGLIWGIVFTKYEAKESNVMS